MIGSIDLSGVWGFRADEEMKGVDARYFDLDPDDEVALPSTTSLQKKGKPNPRSEDGSLTDKYAYEGYAWYYKTVDVGEVQDRTVELVLERTRLTKAWINGSYAGDCDSLCTPHCYDVTGLIKPGENRICVMVSNSGYPTSGGHMTSIDTQSNWNGITGQLGLVISDRSRIKYVRAFPDAAAKSVRLEFELENLNEADISVWGASDSGDTVDLRTYHVTAADPSVTVDLGENARLWDEYSATIYTLKAAAVGSSDIATVSFGLRDIKTDGMRVTVNGRGVQLRGRHDGMIFPLTGAAPTTVEEWHEYLLTVKQWGLNHVRFHTCCPPEAAFTAADMLGMYLQPELPFWGTFAAEGEDKYNGAEQAYLIKEGRRILKCFGSHPSFAMMSLGNELWGSPRRLAEVLSEYRAFDDRHLYTQGSNNFQFYPNILPEDDFFSGVRLDKERLIRGSYAQCDAPLGFVQTEKPNTAHSFDKEIFPDSPSSDGDMVDDEIEIQYGTGVKKVRVSHRVGLVPDKPIVTHETGQYYVYPDYSGIPKYTGPLKPRDLELFRSRLADAGMGELAESFHRASGMLAYNCYKLEIEAAMRSELISGFQLLDLQDFTGQGGAFVGMLDPFMDEKSFVRENGLREKWQGFCSDAAVLAELGSFVLTVGESVGIPVLLRYTRPERLTGASVKWSFGADSGKITVPDGFYGVGKIGEITISAERSGKYTLTLTAEDIRPEGDVLPTCSRNSYDLTAFERTGAPVPREGVSRLGDSTVYIECDLEKAEKRLREGGKVLYMPANVPDGIRGFYCADFWNYPMFRKISEEMGREVPVGTLGLLIDNNSPALADFPCEYYSTPQWYEIVSHAECPRLKCGKNKPGMIVRDIDNVERNHELGLLYEARTGGGSLMVCASRLWEAADKPEIQAFYSSILRYMHSDGFAPGSECTAEELGLRAGKDGQI